jgi:hypothetical protein
MIKVELHIIKLIHENLDLRLHNLMVVLEKNHFVPEWVV